MFTSDLRGQTVIDDSNYTKLTGGVIVDGEKMSLGYIPRDYSEHPEGSFAFAAPFDLEIIHRDEWRDRIEEKEKTKSLLSDARRQHQLKSTNQNGHPYCWAHGCVNTVRLMRASRGLPHHDLEPTMVGALVKNYRKQGGNTWEGVKCLSEIGCCTTEFWKPNSLDRSNDTEAMRENAALHKIAEWYEMKANSFDQLATCLLLGFPVSIGLSWWGHMICAMDLVALDSGYGVRIWNSWGDGWEDNGEQVLTESKATAFDQFALRAANYAGEP